jgi:hypothetical protein
LPAEVWIGEFCQQVPGPVTVDEVVFEDSKVQCQDASVKWSNESEELSGHSSYYAMAVIELGQAVKARKSTLSINIGQ